MTKKLSDEFMQQIATEQAWKDLSDDFTWTETLLEKYADKVDWKTISENRRIVWTIPMLQKFSQKLDWPTLSSYMNDEWFTEEHLEAFKEKWDWGELCGNIKFSDEIISKYGDYINWTALIGADNFRSCIMRDDDFDGIAFYEKYKTHLPISKIQDSDLWRNIVEKVTQQIKTEILSK